MVREFSHHQTQAAVDLFSIDYGTHSDQAAPGTVRLLDASVAEDRCSCWEVRPLNNGNQIVEELFTAGIGWSSAQWTPCATSRIL